jgi:hypothetical protein
MPSREPMVGDRATSPKCLGFSLLLVISGIAAAFVGAAAGRNGLTASGLLIGGVGSAAANRLGTMLNGSRRRSKQRSRLTPSTREEE